MMYYVEIIKSIKYFDAYEENVINSSFRFSSIKLCKRNRWCGARANADSRANANK